MNIITENNQNVKDIKKQKAIKFFSDEVLEKIDGDFCVAGGSIRRFFMEEDPFKSDVDLFFDGENSFNNAKNILIKDGYLPLDETPNGSKFKKGDKTFDLIRFFIPRPISIINDFDLSVCMCSISRNEISYSNEFFEDIANKMMRFNKIDNPVTALRRMHKYSNMGFFMPEIELIKILRVCTTKNVIDEYIIRSNTPKNPADQIKEYKTSSGKLFKRRLVTL